MANVKNREVVVRDVFGVALVSKDAFLKNNASGATIDSDTTDGAGKASFLGLDETLDYRVEVATGGVSSQLYVNGPSSPEVDHLYVNQSLRTRVGAATVLGGPLAVTGLLSANGGLGVTGASTLNGAVNMATHNLTAGEVHTISLYADDGHIDGLFEVSGDTSLNTAYITNLHVGADASIPGTLTGATITAIDVIASGYMAAEGNISTNGSGSFETGLTIGGGTFTVNSAGGMAAYADAVFNNHVQVIGYLALADGSAAAPGLRFSADTDTGIARIGINTVSLVGNGVEALRAGGSGASAILGFYGNTGFVKQTVGGSRGGNAALANLLTALATIGLIANTSTA